MSRSDVDTKFARLKWRRAFSNWERSAAKWIETIKAGYDPNQPRVPAGNPDGGQWASGGGSGTRVAQADSKRPKEPSRNKPSKPKQPEIKLPVSGKPKRGGPPLEKPPQLPKRKPPTNKERLAYARLAARWLMTAVIARRLREAMFVANIVNETGWMDEFRGFIGATFDPPKSLEQLQKEAFEPAPGYDIHHIVEQTPARNAGFPESLINAPENRIRIPRIRHWELNRWYSRKNEKYGMLSPREYLQDKDWNERRRVGLEALIEIGVLKK